MKLKKIKPSIFALSLGIALTCAFPVFLEKNTDKVLGENEINTNSIVDESVGVKRYYLSETDDFDNFVEIWCYVQDLPSSSNELIIHHPSVLSGSTKHYTNKIGWHSYAIYGIQSGAKYDDWRIEFDGIDYPIPSFDSSLETDIHWGLGIETNSDYADSGQENGSFTDISLTISKNVNSEDSLDSSYINAWYVDDSGAKVEDVEIFDDEDNDVITFSDITNLAPGNYELRFFSIWQPSGKIINYQLPFTIDTNPARDLEVVDVSFTSSNPTPKNPYKLSNLTIDLENLFYSDPSLVVLETYIYQVENNLNKKLLDVDSIVNQTIRFKDYEEDYVGEFITNEGWYAIEIETLKHGYNEELSATDIAIAEFYVYKDSEQTPKIDPSSIDIDFEQIDEQLVVNSISFIINDVAHADLDTLALEYVGKDEDGNEILIEEIDIIYSGSDSSILLESLIKKPIQINSFDTSLVAKMNVYTYDDPQPIEVKLSHDFTNYSIELEDIVTNQDKYIKSTENSKLVLNFDVYSNQNLTRLLVLTNQNGNVVSTISEDDVVHDLDPIKNEIEKTITNVPIDIEQSGWILWAYDIGYQKLLHEFPLPNFIVTE